MDRLEAYFEQMCQALACVVITRRGVLPVLTIVEDSSSGEKVAFWRPANTVVSDRPTEETRAAARNVAANWDVLVPTPHTPDGVLITMDRKAQRVAIFEMTPGLLTIVEGWERDRIENRSKTAN